MNRTVRTPKPRGERSARRQRTSTAALEPGNWFEADRHWFKRAVFYEIHIRGFADGNDDGTGDLRGLTDKQLRTAKRSPATPRK